MNILFLGYVDSPLIPFLREQGEQVLATDEKITPRFILSENIEFIISYGYRFILKKDILDMLPGKVINLHISYLPWNRGSDPNFWSIADNTPKGVSIHYIDEGLDTGDILLQQEVFFSGKETLRQSYAKLRQTLEDLFRTHWSALKAGQLKAQPQQGEGSFHLSRHKEPYIESIKATWLDMEINALLDHISRIRADT